MANFVSDQNCKEFFQYVCDSLDDIIKIAKEQKQEIYNDFINGDEPYTDDYNYAANLDFMLQHYLHRIGLSFDELEMSVLEERDAL